eukprot:gene3779-6302_t
MSFELLTTATTTNNRLPTTNYQPLATDACKPVELPQLQLRLLPRPQLQQLQQLQLQPQLQQLQPQLQQLQPQLQQLQPPPPPPPPPQLQLELRPAFCSAQDEQCRCATQHHTQPCTP